MQHFAHHERGRRRAAAGSAAWAVRVACAGLLALAAGGAGAAAPDRALVLSTDYSTAYYSRLELQPPYAYTTNIGSACADAAVRATADRAYILGRYGCDHVQVVDGATFATLRQFSTGNGTNPQDIALASATKAYVSLYERDYLAIFNPETGASLGTVSLAIFDDADGLPEAAGMTMVGDRLFVAVQRLDRNAGFTAAHPSFLAVVDCTTNQLVDADPLTPGVQGVPLTGRNPFGGLEYDAVRRRVMVAEAGNFGALDGGVEYVDPVTLHAEGFFVTEAQLGGEVNGVRLWTDCTGWAIVNDLTYRTKLVRFDRCTHQVLGTAWQSSGFDLCDVEIDVVRGHVLASDRDLVLPGVRIFAAATGAQLTSSPIGLGLPPCDIALLGNATLAAAAPPASALHLVPNWPDPFNPATRLRAAALPGSTVRVEIADVRGRIVRVLWDGVLSSGSADLTWDGRDSAERPVASGVYWALLRCGSEVRRDRLTLVR
jgi:hypothetical protein